MVTTTPGTTEAERRDAYIGHIRSAAIGAFELAGIALGLRLGLYRALRDGGPATPGELAARTGLSERPVREWLEHGAVNGLLELAADSDDPTARRFALDDTLSQILLDRDSLAYFGPTAAQVLAAVGAMPEIEASFRTGAGFAFSTAGDDMRMSEGDGNRPAYLGPLGRDWLPSIPEVHARLVSDLPARIADVGCGLGWSSIGMALAYSNVLVDGLDLDAPSIELARVNAREAGVADRVTFANADAASPGLAGRYDLVTVLEAFHDMSQPVGVLAALRDLLAEGGSIVIADIKAEERFRAPGSDFERYVYGWSLTACLHGSLEGGGVGTGTAMRPAALRDYADAAGLEVEIVPIEHDSWRFYRLTPAAAP